MPSSRSRSAWIPIDPRLLEQAGNYDYPRAGNPSRVSVPPATSDRRPEVTARLRHLRELLDSDRQRDRQRLAIETLDSELLQMSAEPISSRLERRRRGLEAQLRGIESPSVQLSEISRESAESTPPSQGATSTRSRRRPVRPSERLQRYREQSDSPDPTELENIRSRSRLIDPTNTLSPLGERPPRIGSPDLVSQEYSGEAQINFENRWRSTKRRKLDSDDTRQTFKSFSYGHHGQVVPGRLRMELVSCDGGQYSDSNGDRSWPEHVLVDDSSVYCTKSDRCNMILRHQGESPFCLKKLVIKAPTTGFDAAIQEGMIFVSMERDDLLTRTSSYQIQYSPHRRRRRPEQGQIRLQPSHEYFNSVRSPLRSLDSDSHAPPSHGRTDQSRANNQGETHNVPRVPEFRVTTEYDDKSGDDTDEQGSEQEAASVAAEVEFERLLSLHDHYLSRLGRLDGSHVDSEDEDSEDATGWDEIPDPDDDGLTRSRWNIFRPNMIRVRRRLTPSRIQVSTTLESPVVNTGTATTRQSQEPLVPHASFFIRRDKDMVSIKFDPPVSGKFILIKLWAPCPNANIDIQSIIAHGFAGPRFFPATTLQ